VHPALHEFYQVGGRVLRHQMNMIAHQTKQIQLLPVGFHAVRQPLQKPFPVMIIIKNFLSGITPYGHVINRAGKFNSSMSWHAPLLPYPATEFNR